MIKIISLSLFALFPTAVYAIATQGLSPSFNWSLLKGKWAEKSKEPGSNFSAQEGVHTRRRAFGIKGARLSFF